MAFSSVMVHLQDETDLAKMLHPYKVVTNYDSMFSDLPQYPSHSYVPVSNGSSAPPKRRDTRPLHANVTSNVTSSSGLQVTGKDRALFFRRPVLQMSYVMPLPHIRYTRELSLSVNDIAKNDERKKLRSKQYEEMRPKLYEDSGYDSKMINFNIFNS